MGFREINNLSVNSFIKLLQQEYKSNSLKIKVNITRYNNLLEENNNSKEFNKELRAILDYNKELTSENNDLLELHNNILNFIKSQRVKDNNSTEKKDNINEIANEEDSHENVIQQEHDKEQIFSDTINNKLNFDKNHPLYSDSEFKEKLMNHYIESEEYELCAIIKDM